MPRFKRRTRIVLVILILLLLAAGGWVYRSVYVSTGSALQRAESFLFSRMTVAQLGEQGGLRYFYVTKREKTEENYELRYRFGAQRGSGLKFGVIHTSKEPTDGLRKFINPI